MAAKKFAKELGFETEHAQGCEMDGNVRVGHEKDEGTRVETGFEVVVDLLRNGGESGDLPAAGEGGTEDHGDGDGVGCVSEEAGWEDLGIILRDER